MTRPSIRRSSPPKRPGSINLRIENLPAGTYWLELYQTGYRVNDAYTAYLDMGAPDQLTPAQVEALRSNASGTPAQKVLLKHTGGTLVREIPLRQNDVFLVLLHKL